MELVVFLRGINVGGHRRFRPTELAAQLSRYDLINIGTTGTFVVRKPPSRRKLVDEIRRRLAVNTEIVLCRGTEILKLRDANFFARIPARGDIVKFVSILKRDAHKKPRLPLTFPSEGKWLLKVLASSGRFVFGVYRRDMKVIGYLGKLDAIFGARATTRNWNTMMAIVKVLENGAWNTKKDLLAKNAEVQRRKEK